MKLPYFNEDVPVLYLSDGTPYIPVVVLCQILGLRSDSCIRRWRKLLLWSSARQATFRRLKNGESGSSGAFHLGHFLYGFAVLTGRI